MKSVPAALLAGVLLAASLSTAEEATVESDETARLHDLFDREWTWRLAENPLLATSVGVHDHNDRLPSESLADQARRAEASRGFLTELRAIDPAKLSDDDRINYEMFEGQLDQRIGDFELGAYEIPILADDGFHIALARLPFEVPLESVRDYRNYLARLRSVEAYMDQHIDLMRRGLARKMTLAKVVLQGYEVTIDSHVVDDPTRSVFFGPFKTFASGIAPEDRESLAAEARKVISETVVPAYARFLDFITDVYIPGARDSLGASELPEGRAYYAHKIRQFTTLDLGAEEIHQLGLREVARIRGEMEGIIRKVGFDGDFAAFLEFLRTDRRFYAETPEQLLKEAAWIAKRMDAKLPSLFKTLPRLPYGVAPVPDHIAPKYTAGRYIDAPVGGTQPGYYWVNTYALDKRPLYTLEALSLHEAVPGHHLQGALAQEQEGLPPFRRYSYLSAYGEGWGLYSEWLGLEAGFYTDPYSDFGRLTYEMWRACRLVVDTGIHTKGWTRQQTMDYLAENTALPLHEIATETDRYISWPAQALAYKIGELKIKELRRRAEKALGGHFDLREFHDVILLTGSVPLVVLERIVNKHIARETEKAVGGAETVSTGP